MHGGSVAVLTAGAAPVLNLQAQVTHVHGGMTPVTSAVTGSWSGGITHVFTMLPYLEANHAQTHDVS